MSDTLGQDQDQDQPGSMPGGPGGPPGNNPGAQPGGGGAPPGGPVMPGGPPPGFGQPGIRPSMPGAGTRGGGLLKLIQAIRMIQAAMIELPIGSEAHKAALKASQDLSKHVNLGQETQGVTTAGISQLLQQLARSAMAGPAQRPGAQGPPGMPPSMPLPGA